MKSMRRVYSPARVTFCTIVYIPELDGYWAHSLDVLKVCLSSALSATRVPFDLFVLDNGSCREVREFLVELNGRGLIQLLLTSHDNMGKVGAWNVLFPACPGEYIAFCDSDILFLPGWLERSLAIFDAFPDVGMVTGRPSRIPAHRRDANSSATLEWAARAQREGEDVAIERGNLIPGDVLDEFARSIGPQGDVGALADDSYEDVRVRRRGMSAYVYAGHYQFVVPRAVAMRVLPIASERALAGDERKWDEAINQAGLLKLSLDQPLVRHLGNTLEAAELAGLVADHPLADSIDAERAPGDGPAAGFVVRQLRATSRVRGVRRVMKKAYLTLFEALQ